MMPDLPADLPDLPAPLMDEDQRRNMTPDQIAGLVVESHNYERPRGEHGRFATDQNGDGPDRNNLTTRGRLARQAGVSQFQIERARTIQLADPELLKQVVAGAISAADALIRVKTQFPRQPRWPRPSAEDVQQPAQRETTVAEREAKDRMIRVLSQVHGLCRGFDTLNIPALHSSCDAKEIKQWANMARASARALRVFAADLLGERQQSNEARNEI